jgi:hypothetical protein
VRQGHRQAAEGRKRHVAVDADALLLGILVHAVDIQDADSFGELLQRVKPLYCWLRGVFADWPRSARCSTAPLIPSVSDCLPQDLGNWWPAQNA